MKGVKGESPMWKSLEKWRESTILSTDVASGRNICAIHLYN